MSSDNIEPSSERFKRGLASANEETRVRVAHSGGTAPHQRRGLAAASQETRARVAKSGGQARAQNREALSIAGRRGGEVVKERYGHQFYKEIGEKGGGTVKQRYGTTFYSKIGRRGGESVRAARGQEYYSSIGRRGGEARANSMSKAQTETINIADAPRAPMTDKSSAESVA